MTLDWHVFSGLETVAPLPTERRCVLVQIAASTGPGPMHASAVSVAYLRYGGGDRDSPFFVVPGFGRDFVVTHWCDCLGDEFTAPLWANISRARLGDELTPAQMALLIQQLNRQIAEVGERSDPRQLDPRQLDPRLAEGWQDPHDAGFRSR